MILEILSFILVKCIILRSSRKALARQQLLSKHYKKCNYHLVFKKWSLNIKQSIPLKLYHFLKILTIILFQK
jgi:hypothetical protein